MIRTALAWLAGTLVAYALFAITSQSVVLSGLTDIGAPMPLGTRLGSMAHAVMNMPFLAIVVGIAFVLAFAIAKGVKTILKPLAPVAYPIAGGAAIIAMLEIMWLEFEVYPVLGAQKPIGYWLAALSGVIGGYVFARMLQRAS